MEANYDFSVYRKQGYSDDQIFGAMLEKEPLLKVYADQGYTPSQILGAMEPAQHAPPLATDTGDTMRGATEAVKQLPQLMYGAAAGIGAIGESIFGEGGLSSDLKAYGVKKYQEIGADIAKDTKVTDSLTYSWDQFQQGNYGAMVDWMQHGFGYGGVQMLEVLASAGVGAVAGKALLKGTVEQVASRMVAKEAAKITVAETAAISAGELTTKAITKQAVANTAAKIGQLVGVGMQAYGMEAGEIGGGLAEQSVKSGKPLTGAEIAKGLGAIAAAGSLEFVGDKIGLDLILGKSKLFSPAKGAVGLGGKVARAALGTVAAVPAEAGTEYLQTGLEEYGQGHEANILPFNQSPEAQKQAFDAAGLGGLGGGQQAVVGGILSAPTVNDAISTFNASTNASTDLIDSVLAQPAGFSSSSIGNNCATYSNAFCRCAGTYPASPSSTSLTTIYPTHPRGSKCSSTANFTRQSKWPTASRSGSGRTTRSCWKACDCFRC